MKNIDSQMLALIVESASNNLQNNAGMINDLNVFPVPDGDTGTNMSLTFGAAAEAALGKETASCSAIAQTLARASLRGARGNSGVILSQILRGVAAGLGNEQNLSVAAVKSAVVEARNSAYRAIMKPTEGTILTVIREMAEFAELKADEYEDISEFCIALLDAARASLENTPDLLPALKEAGVVDAGGMGIVILLEGAVYALINSKVMPLNMETASRIIEQKRTQPPKSDGGKIKYVYCTEFLINKDDLDRSSAQFMAAIKPKGDCMLVIDDDEIVKVHIHTNHPGFVIEQALKLGELTNLKIDNMRYQHDEMIVAENKNASAAENTAGQKPSKKVAFVAVATGDGIAETFKSAGADIVLEGGQTMNPSTQSILDAVCEADAEVVFVLPNNKNIILAAQQVDDISEANIIVIPTKNIGQGISALLAFEADEAIEQNIKNITEAIGQVRCGQVTLAARDSVVDGRKIKKGEALGIENDNISVVCSDKDIAAFELAESMISDDSAVITIYYGEGTDEIRAAEIADEVEQKHPELDVSVIDGGQSVYSYIIAVE